MHGQIHQYSRFKALDIVNVIVFQVIVSFSLDGDSKQIKSYNQQSEYLTLKKSSVLVLLNL